MDEITIQREVNWVQVDGYWTRYSIMGTQIDEGVTTISNKGTSENRTIFVFIPGNPGHEGLYEEFGKMLLSSLEARQSTADEKERSVYLMFTVSYINHVPLPHELASSSKHKPHEKFSMMEQTRHKALFINENIPRGDKVYLLAHSMGTLMTLSILPDLDPALNIVQVVGLFPALESLSATPYGRFFSKPFTALSHAESVLRMLGIILDVAPSWAKKQCVRLMCTYGMMRTAQPPDTVIHASSEILTRDILFNMLHLANGELAKPPEFPESLLLDKEKVFLFYGTTDGWVPVKLAYEMEKRLPAGHVIIDQQRCGHGFVLRDSKKVVEILLRDIITNA